MEDLFLYKGEAMLKITLITVGKLKEKYFLEASKEYEKRLGGFCYLNIIEIEQTKLPSEPSDSEIKVALEKEAEKIERAIPKGAARIPLCIEGKELDSISLSRKLDVFSQTYSNLCFIIGGSYGMAESIKSKADFKFSMSKMTFPHRLARIMLLEQIYRAFKINQGSTYHK